MNISTKPDAAHAHAGRPRDFGQVARQRQGSFRDASPTVSERARSPSDDKGKRHRHLLARGLEIENLYPKLRGPEGASRFFSERHIQWWHSGQSGDETGRNGVTRNMASSQVACVNFLLPLAQSREAP
jgi:hypothetical protein